MTLSQTLSVAAKTHQTTQLATHIGSIKANASLLSGTEPPVAALHTALKGMVDEADAASAISDASAKQTTPAQDKLPHTTDPVVAITARAGLGVVAGQDIQFTAGEALTLAAGENLHMASGGAARIHTGQSIGMLAGAMQPGAKAAGTGITLIAGQGDIDVQAQADQLQVAAKQDVRVQSQSGSVDWAAAKKIVLATAGGASITIEGGNITVMCPGKITVKAGKKSFVGPEKVSYGLPIMPRTVCIECLAKRARQRSSFVNKGA